MTTEKRRGLNEPSASETGALTCISYGSLSGERSLLSKSKRQGEGGFRNQTRLEGTYQTVQHLVSLPEAYRFTHLLRLHPSRRPHRGVTPLGGRAGKVGKGRGEQANGRRGERTK
ncbi:BnaA02g18680D [Brassica napus]|uniref:BnaA02g18680D protein n=1 Tax=Brassica napus TaxID=3708 RepID=A0A078GQA2_BRANA|nr:BnaA02g18680D [Brassica napus]